MQTPLLKIEDLHTYFFIDEGVVKAVNGVDLTIRSRETLGLVGESGCRKSTLGRCILWLEEPTCGQIVFDGHDVTTLDKKSMRKLRRDMQIVFHDPFSPLNPRKPSWIGV
ncbi:peptide ABC transporter ATP-binding protein, partial [Desulfobacteraceae bacterium SEEP-SAG9]